MARRRQILADIHEFGLDPKKAHTLNKGRLQKPTDPSNKVKPVVENPSPKKQTTKTKPAVKVEEETPVEPVKPVKPVKPVIEKTSPKKKSTKAKSAIKTEVTEEKEKPKKRVRRSRKKKVESETDQS